jgi:hypothetical protein
MLAAGGSGVRLHYFCKRCGRKLKSLRAQQHGAGRTCRKKIEEQKKAPQFAFRRDG